MDDSDKSKEDAIREARMQWLAKTADERFAEVERLRQLHYGYTSENAPRLDKTVFEIINISDLKDQDEADQLP